MTKTETLLDRTFRSCRDQLAPMRTAVREVLVATGVETGEREEMVLALNEAFANVIQHACKDVSDVSIRLLIRRSGDVLVFQLQDQAPPVDVSTVHPRPLDDIRPGGLGTHLMRELMDDVVFLEPPGGNGNLLQMTRAIKQCGCKDGI